MNSAFVKPAMLMALSVVVAGCATPEPRRAVVVEPPPLPSARVYFYPQRGQSAEQQDRDRYECYVWARNQTGFDPSSARLPSGQRVEVVPKTRPGEGVAAGAIVGGAIGAIAGSPHNAGGGAIVGAAAGAIVGAASEDAQRREAERAGEHYDRRNREATASLERRISDYRRATSACLEGRGYSVQ